MEGLWVFCKGSLVEPKTGEFEKGSRGYLGRKSVVLRCLAEVDAILVGGGGGGGGGSQNATDLGTKSC